MPKFLCTADLHIGRQSSGFEGETALSALGRIVDLAIDEGADALLIAGDLFDSIDAQFLTRNSVAAELARLKTNGIRAVAVAGNHDWDALPIFAHACPGLIELVGVAGWESVEVAGVVIKGCSFGSANSRSLMERFPVADDSKLTIGLLHADVDVQSNYNPTKLTDLAGRGVVAWVLGHVHAARRWTSPVAFYPGSPQSLDAGETGVHGVHWLETQGSGVTVSELVPLSTLRFESVELEIGPDELVDEVVSNYVTKCVAIEQRLSLRVVLRRRGGANPSLPPEGVHLDRHFYEIVDVRDVIEQNLDLSEEALQSDARGQAARLLLGLEGRGFPAWTREAQQLVAQVQAEMESTRRKLKLGGREEFRQLEVVPEMESIQAVRSSLESVLAATARGAQ